MWAVWKNLPLGSFWKLRLCWRVNRAWYFNLQWYCRNWSLYCKHNFLIRQLCICYLHVPSCSFLRAHVNIMATYSKIWRWWKTEQFARLLVGLTVNVVIGNTMQSFKHVDWLAAQRETASSFVVDPFRISRNVPECNHKHQPFLCLSHLTIVWL